MKIAHTENFGGDTITAFEHSLDFMLKINDREYGVYTSIEAGVKACRAEVIRRLESK